MKAIILAAGQGTRLKKYTEDLPKGMLSFLGQTIIERQINLYRKCGIDAIVIVKGYAAEKISYEGVKYYINNAYADTNMVESLMTARTEFDDDVIISYSDVLFEEAMLRDMMKSDAEYAVAVDDNWKKYWEKRYGRIDFDTESLSIDENNNIIELGAENPKLENISARYVGLLKFSKGGLQKIVSIMEDAYEHFAEGQPWQQSGKPVRKAYMTDLIQAVIETGQEVKAERFQNGWIEFDTNEDYEKACEWVKSGEIQQFLKF